MGSIETMAAAANIGSLHDKIACITGASSGLGRAIAQAYAAAGAHIVCADLTPKPRPVYEDGKPVDADATATTVDLINRKFPSNEGKPRAAYVECNVTDSASVEAMVAFAVQTYGRLDVMINNAGISAEVGLSQRIHEQDVSLLDKNMAVNVKGVWLGCKHAIAQMLKQPVHPSGDRGWIINTCSVAGLVGMRFTSSYCASKGAVLQITKSVAVEYAQDQIHVNCICPGFANTNFIDALRGHEGKMIAMFEKAHPWGRLAQPDDIAKMAVFLGGEGASFVTGASFTVDGGYVAQ